MTRLLLVVLGGGLGSGARYVVSTWVLARLGPLFPWGTLTVNVLGSFVLGVIMQIALSTSAIGPDARVFLATGCMGGFTTYSTFNYETLLYLQDGNWRIALLNIVVTLVACLLAGFLGVAGARGLSGV